MDNENEINQQAKYFANAKNGRIPLPPLFGQDFKKGNLNWKRLDEVEFEQIGRILTCHLVIETYLNKLLELRFADDVDIDAANLNFSQKLKMLRKHHAFQYVDFYHGISILNKIRNKYSHHLEAKIDSSEIGIIQSIMNTYSNKVNREPFVLTKSEDYEVIVIETFTSIFCAFVAGYCSSIVEEWR